MHLSSISLAARFIYLPGQLGVKYCGTALSPFFMPVGVANPISQSVLVSSRLLAHRLPLVDFAITRSSCSLDCLCSAPASSLFYFSSVLISPLMETPSVACSPLSTVPNSWLGPFRHVRIIVPTIMSMSIPQRIAQCLSTVAMRNCVLFRDLR